MKLGLISDSHDDEEATGRALDELSDVDALIHAGDLCAPFMVELLDEAASPAHIVFGNVDDRHLTTRVADAAGSVTLHGNDADLTFDDTEFYVTHRPGPAELAAETGEYDVVVHGHKHKQRRLTFGDTLLVNPGELLGRRERRGYATYDTEKKSLSLFRLDES